jgi:mannan endo-1,4-beta-mannosidase
MQAGALLLILPVVFGWELAANLQPAGEADEFVRRSGTGLTVRGEPFYSVGVNAYFLQQIAAYGDTLHVREILDEARSMGATTIRTWGFHDAPDASDPAAIQTGPGAWNEHALEALDYVVAAAREYGIRLIIPLVNNWDDYGGMNAYVRWYAQTETTLSKAPVAVPQQFVEGAGGRRYAVNVAGGLTHDDFYRIPVIRGWYKAYCRMLVERTNTLTGVSYRDDPAIMMWELANEPRSSDPAGNLVYEWAGEVSAFIKSVDPHHLVATGEEGHDMRDDPYPGRENYGNDPWFFDGAAGVSFSRNITLPAVDVATVHCYPEAWGLTLLQGAQWIADHRQAARAEGKPVILEEFGSSRHALPCFEMYFSDALYGGSAGVLPWQYVYDGRPGDDGYAFSCPADGEICALVAKYGRLFREKAADSLQMPPATALVNAYPNPFNDYTLISYTLTEATPVELDIYNTLGQKVDALVEPERMPGVYVHPFIGDFLSSGGYFVVLRTRFGVEGRKLLLLK